MEIIVIERETENRSEVNVSRLYIHAAESQRFKGPKLYLKPPLLDPKTRPNHHKQRFNPR